MRRVSRHFVLPFTLLLAACVEAGPTDLENAVVNCELGPALRLRVGETATQRADGSRFCIDAPEGGKYVLVPFLSGPRDTLARVTVSIFGGGMEKPVSTAALQAGLGALGQSATLRLVEGTDALDRELRARERRLPAWSGRFQPRIEARSALRRVPVPGELIQINVGASCISTDRRPARVVAVSSHAIVTEDPANPARGYSQEELRTFAREFDELVYPVAIQNFGTPTDIDGNQRTILHFTRAVNEIVIPGSSAAIAAGFFFRGDLFARNGTPGRTDPCPGSNEGEVLFLAVPDSLGEIRGVPINHATLMQVMTGTIGHELQHLINSGRKLHVVNAPALEESWLNEGLSFIAEELLFYAASGFEPRQNIDTTAIYSRRRTDAFNRFMYSNLGRLNLYLLAPQDWSLMGKDALPTRGAAWSFLRYAADRDPRPDAVLFRALIDGTAVGLANLSAALGQDPLPWIQDWTVSLFTDDFVAGIEPRFNQPSWNARNLISAIRIDNFYPLRLLPVAAGEGFSFRLQTGAAGYPAFSVAAGQRAMIVVRTDGETDRRQVVSTLIRVQ